MSNKREEVGKYTEVWGDTVVLKELLLACLIGVVLTMGFFLVGRHIFSQMENLGAGMADGYALLIGLIGCLLSGFISARLFKPKRRFDGKLEDDNIEHILEQAGMTVEEEAAALAVVDPEIIAELEDLEMYSLLALIPEGTQNYKPEYRERANSNRRGDD